MFSPVSVCLSASLSVNRIIQQKGKGMVLDIAPLNGAQ